MPHFFLARQMETTGAAFVAMLMDRLEESRISWRATVSKLQQALDERAPAVPPVYLMPHNGYLDYSIGFALSWKLLKVPEMYDDRPFFAERKPLDAVHKEAVVLPSGVWLQLPIGCRRYIGKPGEPLRVQKLVDAGHAWLSEDDVAELMDSEYVRGDYGFYNGLGPAGDPSCPNDRMLQLDY